MIQFDLSSILYLKDGRNHLAMMFFSFLSIRWSKTWLHAGLNCWLVLCPGIFTCNPFSWSRPLILCPWLAPQLLCWVLSWVCPWAMTCLVAHVCLLWSPGLHISRPLCRGYNWIFIYLSSLYIILNGTFIHCIDGRVIDIMIVFCIFCPQRVLEGLEPCTRWAPDTLGVSLMVVVSDADLPVTLMALILGIENL